MNKAPAFRLEKIFEGTAVCVFILHIYFACRHAVAKHLYQVFERHFDGTEDTGGRIVISPIFIVMLVSPFVVHPSCGITICFSLTVIWASVSLIKFRAHKKLRWAVLRQVVQQSLQRNACLEAVQYYFVSVFCDSFKMQPGFSHFQPHTFLVCDNDKRLYVELIHYYGII